MTTLTGCTLLFYFIFCLKLSNIVQADALGEGLQPGTGLFLMNDSLVNQCPCTSSNISTNLTFINSTGISLNCSCNISVTPVTPPYVVPSCVSTDPDCLLCSRVDNVQYASMGRCVLFGPTSIFPLNGPSSGGSLTTIYGKYFGSSANAKVNTYFAPAHSRCACSRHPFISWLQLVVKFVCVMAVTRAHTILGPGGFQL
jgi:hypothetical protein